MQFYEMFVDLCNKKNISPTRAAIEAGASRTAVTHWKQRNSRPTAANLKKIADYFGVPVSYFDEKPPFDLQMFAEGGTTEQEQKLIEIYRQLDEIRKAKLLIYADELLQ